MRSLALRLSIFAFSCSVVFATPQFNRCKNVLRILSNPDKDTSVELEIKTSDPILSLLTTDTGTLAPLLPPKAPGLKNGYALPPELAQSFKDWGYEQIAQEPWDNLTPEQKRHFLNWITLRKRTPFFEDRNVPGIKIKDQANLVFSKPTEFLGKSYEAGTHEIDISHLFRQVEYGTPAQNPNMIELHFRAPKPSGEVSNSAWTFLTGVSADRIHQHVHIVSPLDIEQLQKDGTVRSVMLTDFYRRANLALEMIKVVEEKIYGFKAVKHGEIVFWDTLSPERLQRVFRHLESTRIVGKQLRLGSDTKMAFIGFRGSDTYDDPNLIGFEVRGISKNSDEETIRNFLNTLQWTLRQDHYGIPIEKMDQWLKKQVPSSYFEFGNTFYNQPWEKLKNTETGRKFETIDPYLRKLFYDLETNREIKMLIYDWSNDPLLFDKPKLLAQIKREQGKALERLNAANDSQQKIVSEFLVRSGLYGIFTRSIGY